MSVYSIFLAVGKSCHRSMKSLIFIFLAHHSGNYITKWRSLCCPHTSPLQSMLQQQQPQQLLLQSSILISGSDCNYRCCRRQSSLLWSTFIVLFPPRDEFNSTNKMDSTLTMSISILQPDRHSFESPLGITCNYNNKLKQYPTGPHDNPMRY